MKTISTFLTIAGLLVTVEKFYVHPTRGRGIQALLAVIQAGELFS